MRRFLLIAGCFLSLAAEGDAGEIVLRQRAEVRGSLVRLGDVADVKGEEGENAAGMAATPLMPAPSAASTRFLRDTELRDLLAARGVSLSGWRIVGAKAVELGGATASSARVAGAPQEAALNNASGADQLTNLITNYLRQQTGHELWSVAADADDNGLAVLRQGGQDAAISGAKAPWVGRQRFLISSGAAKPVTLYARVDRLEMAAFAVRSIERGELVRRTDLELRPYAGALPTQAITSVDAAIGKEAVQGIREGSLVLGNYVRSPIIVRRGERVSVRARAASIVVRTFAIAQQDGGVGDLVAVQAVDGKERYAARVSGVRELEIFAAEARVTE